MKNVLIVVVILILLGGAGFFFLQNNTTQDNTTSPTPTQTAQVSPQQSSTTDTFCMPDQLTASMDTEVAAGNAYVTLTLENTSKTTCQVVGNNLPEVDYPLSVENFQTVTKRQPTTAIFALEPNQTIYSLIHYPNGPQCSTEATGVDAAVSYNISKNESITFQPTMGTTLSIPSCGEVSEMTTIDLYAFSSEEVTP